mgnify:CR=1 FL=1|tara:strand:- start:966 stop:1349 length:384 start_codon:yes stop_codon:yes gene_type:complete
MITWSELSFYNFNNPPTKQIRRSPQTQNKYDIHKKNLKINQSEHIKKNILKENDFAYTQNSFPYETEKNIKHDIIWSKRDLSEADIREIIIKHNQNMDIEKDCVYFINIKSNQSIPDITHAHVFIKS